MTGHIRRTGSRSWELKFDIGTDPLTGKRRIRYHAFKGTKREAALELARLVSANTKGEYVDPSRETVNAFLIVGNAIGRAQMSAQRRSKRTSIT